MKKNYLAITLGILLSASSSLAACGTADSSASAATVSTASVENNASASQASETPTASDASTSSEAETVEGEVASVDGDTITVNVGTADADDSQDLTLTGETKEVTVTDDTTYEYQMGGGARQATCLPAAAIPVPPTASRRQNPATAPTAAAQAAKM